MIATSLGLFAEIRTKVYAKEVYARESSHLADRRTIASIMII